VANASAKALRTVVLGVRNGEALWPTPTASEGTGYKSGNRRDVWRPGLEQAARGAKPKRLWPTPTASNPNDGEDVAHHLARKRESAARNGHGPNTVPLGIAVKMWPTPTVADRKGATRGEQAQGGMPLCEAVKLWPTPTACDAKSSGAAGYSTESGRHSGTTLTDAVVRGFWPTPAASDGMGGPGYASSTKGSPNLRTEVRWATPTSRDAKGPSVRARRHNGVDLPAQAGGSGKLNAAWVEMLMGFPAAWTDIGGPLAAAKRSTPGSRRAR
jgi:hypothetical protein